MNYNDSMLIAWTFLFLAAMCFLYFKLHKDPFPEITKRRKGIHALSQSIKGLKKK